MASVLSAHDTCYACFLALQLVLERGPTKGFGPDWHMDHIAIHDLARDGYYKWRCGQWFNAKEGLRKTWNAAAAGPGEDLGADGGQSLRQQPGGLVLVTHEGRSKGAAHGAVSGST
jgi:hypothetical protein